MPKTSMKVATVRPVVDSLLLQLLERSGVHNTKRIYLRRERQSRWYLVWNLHLVVWEIIRARNDKKSLETLKNASVSYATANH